MIEAPRAACQYDTCAAFWVSLAAAITRNVSPNGHAGLSVSWRRKFSSCIKNIAVLWVVEGLVKR